MIASTSTLFLATLVFGAASVVGAPVRISDTLSESVARAVVPLPVARAIVDVQDHRRRTNLGSVSRRAARLVYERDEPFAEIVTAREPVSVVTEPSELTQRADDSTIQRRYPRRHLRDFYEKREPKSTIKETTMVVTKTTVHDTPADAAAFGVGAAAAASAGISANQPSVSGFTVKIPIPGIEDASVKASTSTLLSVSSATTIVSPSGSASVSAAASSATATSAATESASVIASTSASVATDSAAAAATATASASATDAASAPSSTATSTDSAAASSATPSGTTADSNANNGDDKSSTTSTTTTNVVSADQPAASGAADSTTTGTTTTTTGDDKTTATTGAGDAAAGDANADKSGAAPTAAAPAAGDAGANASATTNAKSAITVNGLTPAGAVPEGTQSQTDAASRRSVRISTSPIARRTVARSGASWASWARRQV